jgi:hypothetical protein
MAASASFGDVGDRLAGGGVGDGGRGAAGVVLSVDEVGEGLLSGLHGDVQSP